MDGIEFTELARQAVMRHYNNMYDLSGKDALTLDNIYVVWMCKTLQNNKALLSTTVSGDGKYYEVTYNGDKKEAYLDCYTKVSNKKMSNVEFTGSVTLSMSEFAEVAGGIGNGKQDNEEVAYNE